LEEKVYGSQEYDLRDSEAEFISFVPRGANKKQFLVVKEIKELKEDIVKTILETPDEDLVKALQEAGLEGEGAGALVGAAKVLKAYKDALPENAIAILAKCAGLALPEFKKEDVPNKGKETNKQAASELSKEAIAKMDPATQAVVKQLLEENVVTKAEAKEAKQIVKELKEEKILKEYVAKAEDLPHLTIEPLKFGPVLKALGEGHPAEFSEIFRVLKAADVAIEKSELFKEIGKAGSGESDAEAQVYAKARGMVAKDGELTFDEAVCKVLDDNPELYEKYEDERQKTVKRRGK
jgi:Asp-tRNA(Asn)/Glu-tRNA(Gln) amidotransferase B subunit